MNFDVGSKKECANVVVRQDDLLHIVDRVEPMKSNLPPMNRSLLKTEDDLLSVSQPSLLDIVERVQPPKSEKQEVPPLKPPNSLVVETEEGPLVVPTVCSGREKLKRGEEVRIFNFAETASIAPQVFPKRDVIRTAGQSVPPIIKTEYQDRVKEKKIPTMKIAQQLAEKYQFAVYEGNVYVFEYNYYKLCNDQDLEEIIYSVLKRSDIVPSGCRFLQDVRYFLKLETLSKRFTEYDVEQVRKYIGFKNGYLHLDTMKFTAPNPAVFITNYLDVICSPQLLQNVSVQDLKKIRCQNFDQFVYTLAEGNPLIFDRIYEMIGYIVSNDCAAKKLFALMGPSDTGKSKLGALIMNLFNKEATIAIPLGALGERFSLGKLPGKALCVDLDAPGARINSRTAAIIKSLTGGDPTSAENKFESPKTFINRAKLLYATNHPIEMSEKEYVLRDRFVSIPIMRTIPKEQQNTNLLDSFKAEKFLIVMKSIGYYRELVRKNYKFTGDFSLNFAFNHSNSGTGMPLEDMINKFVTEKCSFFSWEQWEYADVLYKSFCDYYGIVEGENDYKNFSRVLHQLYIGKIEKSKKRREGLASPISVFKGIIVKKDSSSNNYCL